MTDSERINNLNTPTGRVDVVLDTDAYNEVDDQYAIAYMLRSQDRLNVRAIYAAPFSNPKSGYKAGCGMEKSYNEILNILSLVGSDIPVYKGSDSFLKDENTPVLSEASAHLAALAKEYSCEKPLYVVAIGAITNVASAIISAPEIKDNIVVVWLGGHAHHFSDTKEFNMHQDIAAARVVMGCKAPFVQLPCMGVVSEFRLSEAEIEKWLMGHGALAEYLGSYTLKEARTYAHGRPWTRVIWDVTAVAWLLNDDGRFMRSRIEKARLPGYDGIYESTPCEHSIRYVYSINRDALMHDLISKIRSDKNV